MSLPSEAGLQDSAEILSMNTESVLTTLPETRVHSRARMKLCRFGDGRLGVVEGSDIRDVTPALDVLPACRYPLPRYDLLIANLPAVIARIARLLPDAPRMPLSGVQLLSPVANPGKIVAAPVNY